MLGPGAALGERAVLESGRRTSTLRATTPAKLAVAAAADVDLGLLRTLAEGHRREEEATRAPADALAVAHPATSG